MPSGMDRLVELIEGAAVEVELGRRWLHVPPGQWVRAAAAARDEPSVQARYFDYLTAVDEQPDGFAVLAHLYCPGRREHVPLRTRLARDSPEIDSLTGVFPGAGWHERETWEMYGIGFRGHPDLRRLLLDAGFHGHPLRKDTPLVSRAVKAWPGELEPAPARRAGPPRPAGSARRTPRAPGQPPADAGWPTPEPR